MTETAKCVDIECLFFITFHCGKKYEPDFWYNDTYIYVWPLRHNVHLDL